MSVYKVLGRNLQGKQTIKKVYETDIKFNKFGKDAIYRYQERLDVEVYKMNENDEWEIIEKHFTPRTEEDLLRMKSERNYNDNWFKWKLKDLPKYE